MNKLLTSKVFLYFIAAPALVLIACLTAHSQTVLKAGKSVKADLKLKETQEYTVSLKAGQFAAVRIRQISIGVYFAVFDPKGTLLRQDDLNGINFKEFVTIDSTIAGEYKIVVGWDHGEPQSGAYEITLDRIERAGKNPVAKTKQLVDSWYSAQSPGAAVAVIKNNEVVFKSVKGLASVEHNAPITNSTVFETASVSKQFTAFAIAMLADQGALAMDDDIRKYLPEVPDLGKKITVKNLVHHTSGLRDWDLGFQLAGYRVDDVTTNEMIMNFVARQKQLNFDPGEASSYSNTNYVLLAMIVERVTKRSFSDWTKDNMFAPLGMHNTFFKMDNPDVIKNEAFSYASDGPPFKLRRGNLAAYGTASLHSSIDDLIKWVNNFDQQKVGSKKVHEMIVAIPALNSGQKFGYAFGNEMTFYRKTRLIQHLGLTLGYRASIRRFPRQKLAVIYVSNDGNDATYNRAVNIADLYLAELEPLPPPVLYTFPALENLNKKQTVPAEELTSYTGSYYSDELNTVYDVAVSNGELTARHPRTGAIVLQRAAADSFTTATPFMQKLDFVRDDQKEVTAFKVTSGGNKNILFHRRRTDN